MASVALDLVTRNDAQPASPAVHLGDRDLPMLLAYLAALRLGHAVAFLPASSEILSEYQPEFIAPAPGSGTGLADAGYRPAAEPVAAGTIFQRKQPASPVKFTSAWHCC